MTKSVLKPLWFSFNLAKSIKPKSAKTLSKLNSVNLGIIVVLRTEKPSFEPNLFQTNFTKPKYVGISNTRAFVLMGKDASISTFKAIVFSPNFGSRLSTKCTPANSDLAPISKTFWRKQITCLLNRHNRLSCFKRICPVVESKRV